jgi:hypothetical protein
MFRIDADGNVSNQFSEGNPATGAPGTKVSSDWLNAVQEELAAVIEAAGLTLSKVNNGQLLAALSPAQATPGAYNGVWRSHPTIPVRFQKIGQRVLAQGFIQSNGSIGSSNSFQVTTTGLPVGWRPTQNIRVPVWATLNNASAFAYMDVTTGGGIMLYTNSMTPIVSGDYFSLGGLAWDVV